MTFDVSPLRAEYPWEGRRLDVGGAELHYRDVGQGDPVVMVHGNPTWSFYYRRLVTALSATNRCIVPDHVGCGLSDKPDDATYRYTLDRRVDDLEKLLDHAGVKENVTLVLHDWGGMIGLAWATRHPERVKRLVLLNTAGFSLPTGRALPWQIGVIRHLPLALAVRGLNAFSRGAVWTCSTVPGRLTPLAKRGLLAPYDSWKHRIAVHRFVEDIPLRAGDPAWATVQGVSAALAQWNDKPVLICWGAKDFVFDDSFLAEWRRRLPAAEVHYFPDAGHYVLEDAHERIVPLVKDFFARHPASA